jgi:hypothetical protein
MLKRLRNYLQKNLIRSPSILGLMFSVQLSQFPLRNGNLVCWDFSVFGQHHQRLVQVNDEQWAMTSPYQRDLSLEGGWLPQTKQGIHFRVRSQPERLRIGASHFDDSVRNLIALEGIKSSIPLAAVLQAICRDVAVLENANPEKWIRLAARKSIIYMASVDSCCWITNCSPW